MRALPSSCSSISRAVWSRAWRLTRERECRDWRPPSGSSSQFVRHRPDDLIGLITFARYADTLSPLTYGHDALVEIVRELDIQERPAEDGTGYGDALALACARLDQMGQWQPAAGKHAADPSAAVRSKVVVLLTDGENNCGLHLPEEAAGLAKKWGIRVYAISMKDDAGRKFVGTARTTTRG